MSGLQPISILKYTYPIVCFVVVLASAQGVFSQPPDEPGLVHFGDVIDVDVEGSFEFDWRGRLTPEGMLVGFDQYGDPIPAICRTEAAIAADVAKVLSKVLREPRIVVRVVDRSGRAVATLDGAVRIPHRFRIDRKVRLQELIVLAGGITDESGGEISIFRPPSLSCRLGGATPESAVAITNIKVSDLIAGKPDANPEIVSGDLVTVLKALPIYVIGGVRNPRPIASRDKLTLSRVVSIAGGLAKDSDGEVNVFRRQGTESTVIKADIKRISAGTGQDVDLLPYDIVDVSQKGREPRKTPPLIVGRDSAKELTLPLKIVD